MAKVQWDHYQALLAALETGSLSGAARILGLTQPTLSRQIATLESALGEKLFVRTQQGLRPTDVALAIAPHLHAMEGLEGALRRAASGAGDEPTGTVRISVAEIVGVEVMPPILADIRARYPEIELELMLTDAQSDILHGEADIAVRMTRPTQSAIVARKLGEVRSSLYAHQFYLQRYGTPLSKDELMQGHTLIGFDRETPWVSRLATKFGISRNIFAIRTDSDHARLAMVRAAVGISFVPDRIAAGEPALTSVLPDVSFTLEMWLAMHEDQRGIARVRVVYDALAAAISTEVTGGLDARDFQLGR